MQSILYVAEVACKASLAYATGKLCRLVLIGNGLRPYGDTESDPD